MKLTVIYPDIFDQKILEIAKDFGDANREALVKRALMFFLFEASRKFKKDNTPMQRNSSENPRIVPKNPKKKELRKNETRTNHTSN